MRHHTLFANQSKCEFSQTELTYLGHRVSNRGVAVDQSKIEAIRDWPLPTTIRGLRGFLGITGYYRRFVRQYANIAGPLTDLLRKQAFTWTPASTQAFDHLKHALMHTPVLSLPDFALPFVIHTDASGTGIGVVLSQQGHVVAYFSKQLSPRMRQASAYA